MHRFLATMLQTIQDYNSPPASGDSRTTDRSGTICPTHSTNRSYRVLSLFIAVLPGILAVFVALTLFTLIGMALSTLLRKGLALLKFDDRLNRGTSEWAPSSSPTALIARVRFLGMRSAWIDYRSVGFRRVLCNRRTSAGFDAALLDASGWRNPAAHCGNPDRPVPGALRAHRRSQCATAICEISFPRREMAGAGAYRRHGA